MEGKMIQFHKKKGFTLLELMIVVIIIGILATLALPRFLKAASKARWAAAASTLGIIRSSQMRYYAEFTTYSSLMSQLDIDLPSSAEWAIETPAGTSAEIGKVRHINSPSGADTYTISDAGVLSPSEAY